MKGQARWYKPGTWTPRLRGTRRQRKARRLALYLSAFRRQVARIVNWEPLPMWATADQVRQWASAQERATRRLRLIVNALRQMEGN